MGAATPPDKTQPPQHPLLPPVLPPPASYARQVPAPTSSRSRPGLHRRVRAMARTLLRLRTHSSARLRVVNTTTCHPTLGREKLVGGALALRAAVSCCAGCTPASSGVPKPPRAGRSPGAWAAGSRLRWDRRHRVSSPDPAAGHAHCASTRTLALEPLETNFLFDLDPF